MNGLLFAHMPGYLIAVLHYGPKDVAPAVLSGIVAQSLFVVVFGWLSDSVARIRLHRLGSALLLIGAWPFYTAVVDHRIGLIAIFVAVGLASGLVNGPVGALLADLYETPVRFTGIAFSYNVCNAFFQGLAPLAATVLIEATGSTVSPALFLGFAALIGVGGGLFFGRFGGGILRLPPRPARAPRTSALLSRSIAWRPERGPRGRASWPRRRNSARNGHAVVDIEFSKRRPSGQIVPCAVTASFVRGLVLLRRRTLSPRWASWPGSESS